MEEFFSTTWFTIREEAFTYGEILFSFLFVLVCLSLYWLFYVRYLPKYFEKVEETGEQKRRREELGDKAMHGNGPFLVTRALWLLW